MALTWDFTNCKDSAKLKSDEYWPYTNILIWYTMFTDIGWEITEENAAEFYARIHLLEKLGGPLLTGTNIETGEKSDIFITPEHVRSVIGLQVNVAPLTRLQWVKKKVIHNQNQSAFMDEYTRDFNKPDENEEVA